MALLSHRIASHRIASHRIASHRIASQLEDFVGGYARARARQAITLIAVACAMAPTTAWSLSLTASAQLGVSKSSATSERWSVWARRSDGLLLERRDDPSIGNIWYPHSALGIPGPTTLGVTATSWTSGGTANQRVYYIANNQVIELTPGLTPASDAWVHWDSPPGRTLTGYAAATWGYENGVRYLWVFATMTNGELQVLRISGTSGVWNNIEAGVNTTTAIAASNSPTGDYIRVFARKSNSVWMERHASGGTAWTGLSVGQPAGAVPVCGTMAAAEGTINATYRVYLFCTRAGATDDKLYVAAGDSVADNVLDWSSRSTPGAEQLRNTGYALAATRRPDAGAYAIDAFVLTTGSNLYYVKHTTTSGQITQMNVDGNGDGLIDGALGSDRESMMRRGGMAAVPSGQTSPSGQGYSYGFYVGLGVSADHLYRRVGENSIHFPDYDPESWLNHQAGDPWHTVVPVSQTNHAESSTALAKGRAITVAIHHPGPDPADHAWVDAFWSWDDGDTWDAGTTMPNNGADYVSDPTVDFMDDGTAHILLLGQTFLNHQCNQSTTGSDVFWVTTTDGDTYTYQGAIDDSNANDHPFGGIYRNATGLDRFHAAWWDMQNGAVKYRTREEGGNWDQIRTLDTQNDKWPVLTVGQAGATFVAWNGRICKISSPNFDACTTTPWVFSAGEWAVDQVSMAIPPFDISEAYIEGEHGFSIRASPTLGNVLYMAYQRTEPGGTKKDIWFARLTYTGGTPPFTPSPPVRVTTLDDYEDDADQFGPAVSVSGMANGGGDLISVSWYDRRSPDGDCEGEVNRCYRARRSVSLDSGQTFVNTQYIPMAAGNPQSDPELLPLHCRPSRVGVRFIGEYHETTGDFLHTMQTMVGVPAGSNPESSGLVSRWVSPGYYYGSEP